MAIANLRTKKVLAEEFTVCTGLWSQARGLMFSGRKCLVFKFTKERRVSLHMFFVFFPIDVLFLNHKLQVVEIKMGLLPFSYYAPQHRARYIVEIPSEGKLDVKVGDLITLG